MGRQRSRLQGFIVFIAVVAVVIGFIGYNKAAHMQQNVTDAGYTNVTHDGISINVKAPFHGCTLGFAAAAGPARTINGHSVQPFKITVIQGSTRTEVPMGNDSAPTPSEVLAYMAGHRQLFTCFTP